MFFKRALIALFLMFSLLMLFIFFARLSNGQDGFFGLSDLFNFFETQDFKKPLDIFVSNFTNVNNVFEGVFNKMTTGVWFIDIALPITALLRIGQAVCILGTFIFSVLQLVVNYFTIFGSFINYIISLPGWVPFIS